jgi:Tol biopolymer transport system component
MKRRFVIGLLVIGCSGLLALRSLERSPAAGPQGQDGLELFEPGIISTDGGEIFPTFSPDGRTLYFNTHEQGWRNHTLVASSLGPDGWSTPEVLPFSGHGSNDRAPRLSPDGGRLFFSSDRPLPGGGAQSFNIWVVDRTANGDWSMPRPLPAPVNTEANEFHTSLTADGTLYFAGQDWPGGLGRSDIYRAKVEENGYALPENLGPPINSELSQTDMYVSPDGSFMIFVITDHPDGYGGDDLWISYFKDGAWTAPKNLGHPVNSPQYEYGPTVSPDGRYLYFSSHRRGLGDIYRIQLEELPTAP